MELSTYNLYYFETNIICIVLLLTVYFIYRRNERGAEKKYFAAEIFAMITYCVCDIAAAFFKGMDFTGVRIVLLTANTLYVAMPLLIAVLWERYLCLNLYVLGYKKGIFEVLFALVVFIFWLVSLSSPLTGFSFTLDENNVYKREFGAYIVPLVAWSFMIYLAVKVVLLARRAESYEDKRHAMTMSYFAYPPMVCSIIQMLLYGATVAQVGMTFAIVLVFAIDQMNLISKDELTGMDNKREYQKHMSVILPSANNLLVCMIDVDNLKSINELYGHLEGDIVLKKVSQILYKSAHLLSSPLYIARVGGDKFVAVAHDCPETVGKEFKEAVEYEVNRFNDDSNAPYSLGLLIGISYQIVEEELDIDSINASAKEALQEVKESKKA